MNLTLWPAWKLLPPALHDEATLRNTMEALAQAVDRHIQ